MESRRCRRAGALSLLILLALSSRAGAFEFFDRRLQIHGFYEVQLRGINQDLHTKDDWDLTQAAQVLNLEIEADLAPDGWGPFDFASAFVRLEARYDCVWNRACGLFPSADVYGDRASKQPERLENGRRSGFTLNAFNFNTRPYRGDTPPTEYALPLDDRPSGSRRVYPIDRTVAFFSLFLSPGPDQIQGTADDPGPFVFSRYFSGGGRCKFSTRRLNGPPSEVAVSVQNLGPVDPRCDIEPIAAAADKPNPFRGQVNYYNQPFTPTKLALANGFTGGDWNPITGNVGTGDLPLRPAPDLLPGTSRSRANGLWMPNRAIASLEEKGSLARFNGNYSQNELAWNRGQSQDDEKELKEAYLDLEFFDSRLWLRLGKQSIVWGKTELFRNQDQFNPQDFALSTLPSLEESRIGLWAARGVWSFYDVGIFQDVRLELAVNYDQYESGDFGRCGEPYSVVLVCAGYFGFLAHGITGIGLAGVREIPDPWDSSHGLEYGGRIEWRWKRFSFALTDYYGYQDLPYVERVFQYQRNVDPSSGISRVAGATGDCATPAFEANPGYNQFLGSTPTNRFFQPRTSGVNRDCLTPANALTQHHANQTVFAHSCATLIGLVQQAPEECGNQFFNSDFNFLSEAPATNPEFEPIISALIANQYAGNFQSWNVAASAGGALPRDIYLAVRRLINQDPCDGLLLGCTDDGPQGQSFFAQFTAQDPTLNTTLTVQQQALLGCGQFYGIDCERDGLDLFNTEASAIMQSFVGFEGSFGDVSSFDFTPQPGTVGYVGGPVATRFVGGGTVILPGARGANDLDDVFDDDPGYNPGIDGCSGPLGAAATALTPGCLAGESAILPDGSVSPARTTGNARLLFHPFAGRDPGPNGEFDFAADGDVTGTDDCFAGPDGMCGTSDDGPQIFASEMAAVSFNAMLVLAGLSLPPQRMGATGITRPAMINEVVGDAGGPSQPFTQVAEPFRLDGCSLAKPQYCKNFVAFARAGRVQRNTVNAGGNGRYGRRDFQWHEGAPLVLAFEKANVLGFSTDFAEDWSKSNWSLELTWINNLPFTDNDEVDGLTDVDTYNLTVSVDRPTFVNFLNANRTFFINSQFFFQYVDGYRNSFPSNGPWNILGTLTVTTGYFQDRLLPVMTLVWDKNSDSGAFLPQVTYRFTENFSATFGMSLFAGSVQKKTMALVPPASGNRVTPSAYFDYAENGLSVIRDRDEAFLRLKYTF